MRQKNYDKQLAFRPISTFILSLFSPSGTATCLLATSTLPPFREGMPVLSRSLARPVPRAENSGRKRRKTFFQGKTTPAEIHRALVSTLSLYRLTSRRKRLLGDRPTRCEVAQTRCEARHSVRFSLLLSLRGTRPRRPWRKYNMVTKL